MNAPDTMPRSLAERFAEAETLAVFMDRAESNRDLWLGTARRSRLDAATTARAAAITARRHVLVLVEDWCGDAVNTVPVLQRVVDAMPDADLRVLERDRNPDLMDAHLTNGARSIPLAIVYDADFTELGQWGPRPSELQAWVLGEGKRLDKDARYKQVRTFYARDRGATTAAEFLDVLERDAGA